MVHGVPNVHTMLAVPTGGLTRYQVSSLTDDSAPFWPAS